MHCGSSSAGSVGARPAPRWFPPSARTDVVVVRACVVGVGSRYHTLPVYRTERAWASFRTAARCVCVDLVNNDSVAAEAALTVVARALDAPLPWAAALMLRAHFCGRATVFIGCAGRSVPVPGPGHDR
jgi:hypothetical protein